MFKLFLRRYERFETCRTTPDKRRRGLASRLKGWRKLDGSQCGRAHPGMSQKYAVRDWLSSEKRQTKPMRIGPKSKALNGLT